MGQDGWHHKIEGYHMYSVSPQENQFIGGFSFWFFFISQLIKQPFTISSTSGCLNPTIISIALTTSVIPIFCLTLTRQILFPTSTLILNRILQLLSIFYFLYLSLCPILNYLTVLLALMGPDEYTLNQLIFFIQRDLCILYKCSLTPTGFASGYTGTGFALNFVYYSPSYSWMMKSGSRIKWELAKVAGLRIRDGYIYLDSAAIFLDVQDKSGSNVHCLNYYSIFLSFQRFFLYTKTSCILQSCSFLLILLFCFPSSSFSLFQKLDRMIFRYPSAIGLITLKNANQSFSSSDKYFPLNQINLKNMVLSSPSTSSNALCFSASPFISAAISMRVTRVSKMRPVGIQSSPKLMSLSILHKLRTV